MSLEKDKIEVNFCMIRETLYEKEQYINYLNMCFLSDIERINFFREDNIFMEAILVANQKLYEAINKVTPQTKSKTIKKILNSLTKYYSRMSSRTTPYGLFSSTSFFTFDDIEKSIQIHSSLYQKKIQTNAEWILNLIRLIERKYIDKLVIEMNSALVVNHNMIIKSTSSIKKGSNNNSSFILRKNKFLNQVLEALKEPISVAELVKHLKKFYNNTSEIISTVEILLLNGIIISELRSFFCVEWSDLNYIIDFLERVGDSKLTFKLKEIIKYIDIYSDTKLGEGIDIYKKIINKMEAIVKSSVYININVVKADVLINREVKSEIEKVANFLFTYSPYRDSLLNYKECFIEKYGYNVSVPIGEEIASWTEMYEKATLKKVQKFNSKIYRYLDRKLVEAINQNRKEVIILDDEIQGFEVNTPSEVGALYWELALFNVESSDEKYILNVSDTRGSIYMHGLKSRFSHLISNDNLNTAYRRMFKTEQNDSANAIATISDIPKNDRYTSISICQPNYRQYVIPVNQFLGNNKSSLRIDKIAIGVSSETNDWYVYSKELGEKIKVKDDSFLNPAYHTDIARLLLEISNRQNLRFLDFFDMLHESDRVYQPRIVYSKTVLKEESWKLKRDADTKFVFTEFVSYFYKWKEMWKLPRYVYMFESNKRLFLDINQIECIKIIMDTLQKSKYIYFFKADPALKEQEIVATVRIKKTEHNLKKIDSFLPCDIGTKSDPILQTAINYVNIRDYKNNEYMNKWIDIHLYYRYNVREVFLEIYNFINKQNREDFIFSFVRYYDGRDHIRFRFSLMRENSLVDMLDWLNYLYKKDIITEYTIKKFFPEIEKFGGKQLIKKYERYLVLECKYVLNKILNDDDKILVTCEFLVRLINLFEIPLSMQSNYIYRCIQNKDSITNKEINTLYLKYKHNMLNLNSEIEVDSNALTANLKEYVNAIFLIDDRKELTNYKHEIFQHVFHQFCNRMGISKYDEDIIKILVYKSRRDVYEKYKRGIR